jgi:predicted kinase
MVKLFMMIGLVGSGKSYYAQQLATKYDAEIFSSDSLREEMFEDVDHQTDNDALFKELHKRIRECLSSGKSACYDACNINYKRRMEFLKSLNKIPCEKVAIIMATPYEVCLERNAQRERKVSEYVIKRMYMNWNTPYWYEGWDDIRIAYSEGAKWSTHLLESIALGYSHPVFNYNQNNKHHSLSLGEHLRKAYRFIYKDIEPHCGNTTLEMATALHDMGKPFCATYYNKKGEKSDECHYYDHQNTSAYDCLFEKPLYNVDILEVAVLIMWHMRPYLAWDVSEKAMQKDKKLLGEELFNEILELHTADIYAH